MKKKTYNIGLFGFGTLGGSLYQLIQQSSLPLSIKTVCIKDPGKDRGALDCLLTTQKEDILDDEDIDLVVELINDDQIAFEIARRTLKQGKCFVSANKKMIATNLSELHRLAAQNNRSVRYEAAVCAAIPVIKSIDHHFQMGELTALRGIFNGSTNYILSAMHALGQSFDEALEEAIERGFAEEDSWSDISGADPNYKSCILAFHAFGKIVRPEDTFTRGIQGISAREVRIAVRLGAKIKLVSTVERFEKGVQITTIPRLLTSEDRLFDVHNEFNAVQLESSCLGNQFYLGKGAGGYPSSGAVLADIVATLNDQTYCKQSPIPVSYHRHAQAMKYCYLRLGKGSNKADLPGEIVVDMDANEAHQWLISKVSATQLAALVEMLSAEDFLMEVPAMYLREDQLINAISEELALEEELT